MVNHESSSRPPITRRDFHRLGIAGVSSLLLPAIGWAGNENPQAFVHPGILHTSAGLQRMRNGVRLKQTPIFEGFATLSAHPCSQLSYTPHPFGNEIGRNPSVNFPAFDNDANAAYQCALMAAITGDMRYASLARTIVLGWSRSLQTVSGADAVLMAGLGPFKFINAAEILRALGELDATGVADCAAMLHRAILPAIIDFAPFANGNWDTAAIKIMLAIAVFCDDHALYERALLYYLHGDGDGRLTHYIYQNGQCQESGRDQQHTQLGLAHMGDACEIVWNQGLDLYGAVQSRLLRGFEYTAAYNLGDPVEFKPDIDRTGKYRHQIISPRGTFRPVYEQIYAHYHVRCGLPTPVLARVVARIRPEGAAHGADHPGFGTLLYALSPQQKPQAARPVAPAALHAQVAGHAIELRWLTPRLSGSMAVERAVAGAAFRTIKPSLATSEYHDRNVMPGHEYRYRVVDHRAGDKTALSGVAAITAGLPAGWSQISLGNVAVPQSAQFDGAVLTVCGGGTQFMNPSDEGLFVSAGSHCTTLQARFVPQTASQFVRFGVAWRADARPDAPSVALLIAPLSGNSERHGWHVQLLAREQHGSVQPISDHALTEPTVDYGRLMRPVWLRLERKAAVIQGQFSLDGTHWTNAGQAQSGTGPLGMVVCSGIAGVNSNVRFNSIQAIRDKHA